MRDDAEPLEVHQRRAEVLDARVLDRELRFRHRGEADERADLDVVGPDAVGAAAQRRAAVDGHRVGADALDAGAERDEEVGEILHVRLGGGVAQHGRSFGHDRGG